MSLMPLPSEGCFTATYPNTKWQEVPCSTPPPYPQSPPLPPRPMIGGGNNNSIAAEVPAGSLISAGYGSFDSVTGVTSESGKADPFGTPVPNAYTLQLNTNHFTTAFCAGSTNAGCKGGEQFVFANDGIAGSAYIQYWVYSYTTPSTTCPGGWTPSLPDCFINSTAVAVPNQPITNLGNLRLAGTVNAISDSVKIWTSLTVSATAQGNNFVTAAAGWRAAEFNVFGNCCGNMANFNSGSVIVPRTRLFYSGTGPITCTVQGFTGERNNLDFGPDRPATATPGPALLYKQSSTGSSSFCAAASIVGDTHLTTFDGLLYDFQASGDFVLAQVDPDFAVQNRQVSGAPTWPDASVNSAVATRMGQTQVAICLAPAGSEPPARLHIDRQLTELADGKYLSQPDGVDIWRTGNVYVITDASGNSVRAQVNPGWIDVRVGLGRWPNEVHGLAANANGNVNELEARNGTVLQVPFSFKELYDPYGESWRVQPEESLLSVCGDKEIESRNPDNPFYANDLPKELSDRSRAICTEAGVKEGPLLDACILDVAVIDNQAAADVYVNALAPIAVATPAKPQ